MPALSTRVDGPPGSPTAVTPGPTETARPVPPQKEQTQAESQRRWQTRLRALLEPGRQRGNIAVLDGVRAIACLLVVGYHIDLITRDTRVWFPPHHPLIAPFLLMGGAGVTLFFVLSGFLLFLPYARALLQESNWPSARRFYMRRALRIIPAYYICLFTIVLLEHREYFQPDHWGQLALFLIFFMDASHATFQAINGPFWTLAVEWQFYLLLPLLVLGMRVLIRFCKPDKRLLLLLFSLFVLITWGAVSQYFLNVFPASSWPTGIVWKIVKGLFFGESGKYLQDFAVGMLVCLFYTLIQLTEGHGCGKEIYQKFLPWFWYSGLALLIFMAFWRENAVHGNGAPWLNGLKGAYPLLGELGLASGFALCILFLLHVRSPWQRLLALPPVRWMGNISYSTYMWHLPLLYFLMGYIKHHSGGWNPLLIFGSYWIWVLLVIIPFSVIAFLLTERPGMWVATRV